MHVRTLIAALACAGSGFITAPVAEAAPAAAVVEFTGFVTLGCLNCWEPGGIDAASTVVHPGGLTTSRLAATVWENTTPDPCPVLLQAFGEFEVAGMTGNISWLRSVNELAITVDDVDGLGFTDAVGAGSATVIGNPVDLVLESCGGENVTYQVAGAITITG